MIYSENLDDDESNSDEPQAEGTAKPITISAIGESNASLESSLASSQEKEESEKRLKSSFWMPVETDGLSEEQMKQLLDEPDVHSMELPQISQSNLLHRKANLNDFKMSIDNPTVLPPYIELYVRF